MGAEKGDLNRNPWLAKMVRVCSGETANTNLIVFGFTRSRLEPIFYHTPDEIPNHYTTDVVVYNIVLLLFVPT
jgi:hypothetical protein